MEHILLQYPGLMHKQEVESFFKKIFDHGEFIINDSAMFDQASFEPWPEHTTQYSRSATVGTDWVVSSTLFADNPSSGKIIGMIDIWRSITHPFLSQFGGHIGYSVQLTEGRKGYAKYIVCPFHWFIRSNVGMLCI